MRRRCLRTRQRLRDFSSRYRADLRAKDEWLGQNGYPVDLFAEKFLPSFIPA
jgi:hypothetical protein